MLPDPATLGEPERAGAAQRLVRYLAQPFVIAEPFTSRPGERTPVAELLDTTGAILDAFVQASRASRLPDWSS